MSPNRLSAWPIHVAAAAIVFLLCAMPMSAGAESPSLLSQLDGEIMRIAARVSPTVVSISCTVSVDASAQAKKSSDEKVNDKKGAKGPSQQLGSGVIATPDGNIVTSASVVQNAQEIRVTLHDKRTFKAELVGTDPASDIAVIKIDAKDLPIAPFADSDRLGVGQMVFAVGNHFGLDNLVTLGIVGGTGRQLGIIAYEDFIVTDTKISPGAGGGPLVDMLGQLVGINTAAGSSGGRYQGLSFAIPSNTARIIANELVTHGKVTRGLLGVNIQDLTADLAKSFGAQNSGGALVAQVIAGGPSEQAGLKIGDIVLSINGLPVAGAAKLKNMIAMEKPGAVVRLTVFRDGKTLDVNVTLGERSERATAPGPSSVSTSAKERPVDLGVEVENVPPDSAKKAGAEKALGVMVKQVKAQGAGAWMGLKTGDIIKDIDGKLLFETSDFNDALRAAKENRVIRLRVQRGSGSIFLAGPIE